MVKRAVRRGLLVGMVALILAPFQAQAQSDHRGYGGWAVQQGGQRGDRSDARDEQRRQRDASPRQPYDRGGSLTPDERRELNRDLQRANREFYRKERERR